MSPVSWDVLGSVLIVVIALVLVSLPFLLGVVMMTIKTQQLKKKAQKLQDRYGK